LDVECRIWSRGGKEGGGRDEGREEGEGEFGLLVIQNRTNKTVNRCVTYPESDSQCEDVEVGYFNYTLSIELARR
jgi:hypothetical protein